MKRCSTWLIVTKDIQVKTTMRYHLTTIRMTIIKNLQKEDNIPRKRKKTNSRRQETRNLTWMKSKEKFYNESKRKSQNRSGWGSPIKKRP